jgi:tetratricopeptide (TPR) repeat protein
LAEAHDYFLRALPLVKGSGHVEAVVESNLSQICAAASQHAGALEHANRELELRSDCGDPAGEGYALHDVAVAHQGLANHRAAMEFGERAIALFRTAVATERYLADALETVARSHCQLGAESQASRYLVEAAAIRAELGSGQAQGGIASVYLAAPGTACGAVRARPGQGVHREFPHCDLVDR